MQTPPLFAATVERSSIAAASALCRRWPRSPSAIHRSSLRLLRASAASSYAAHADVRRSSSLPWNALHRCLRNHRCCPLPPLLVQPPLLVADVCSCSSLPGEAKLRRRRQELTQTTPNQPVDDEAVYYKVASECPKGRVYCLGSLGRKKRRYANADASTSQQRKHISGADYISDDNFRDGIDSVSVSLQN
ncbi:hypothetical protein Syun_009837 [Stephania yunnanensis]|uniref:Uncharacterized protein n=1 Tax=Stephania yunnanensis TaxID=152371 RepID=A0AAP0KF97_9MAGN